MNIYLLINLNFHYKMKLFIIFNFRDIYLRILNIISSEYLFPNVVQKFKDYCFLWIYIYFLIRIYFYKDISIQKFLSHGIYYHILI